MEHAIREARFYTVRGHAIRVFPVDDHRWGVCVDGIDLGPRFSSDYDAWAAGAADSYGRRPGTFPRTLAAIASEAAARQRQVLNR
jgi:hypothetical protein